MSSKRHTKRSSNRSVPYDKHDVNTWSSDQIKKKLLQWNIRVPSSRSKTRLKSLYAENLSHRSNPRQEDPHVSGTALSAPGAIRDQNSDHESSNVISSAVNVLGNDNLQISGSSEISQALGFMKTMNNLFGLSSNTKESINVSQTTLEKFGGELVNISANSQGSGSYGIHPESLGNIDYVSESIRSKIIEGKYVNLASLLIPEYELLNESKSMKDTRFKGI